MQATVPPVWEATSPRKAAQSMTDLSALFYLGRFLQLLNISQGYANG